MIWRPKDPPLALVIAYDFRRKRRLQPMDDKTKKAGMEVATVALAEVAAGKNPLYSKTFWAGLLMAAVPLAFPPAAAFMAANPALYGALSGGIVIGLRHVTADGFRWPWQK